ncbi:MAG TPA: hypothetical protein VED63_08715 [Acidimicrobiales bacterium]|nr:hypothetical protein [Acidimicrobiales bacterium]
MDSGDRPVSVRRYRQLAKAAPALGPATPRGRRMAVTNDELTRLVGEATTHVLEAERLLALVDGDAAAPIGPLGMRVRRCAAEISVLSGID